MPIFDYIKLNNTFYCLFQEGDLSSIADMLRATAEEAMTQTGFVFDEATGMYYDQSTGFYYDSVCEIEFHTVAEMIYQLYGFKFNKCGAPVLLKIWFCSSTG